MGLPELGAPPGGRFRRLPGVLGAVCRSLRCTGRPQFVNRRFPGSVFVAGDPVGAQLDVAALVPPLASHEQIREEKVAENAERPGVDV